MTDPVTALPKTFLNRAIKLMLLAGLAACLYVFLRGCERPNAGLGSYAVGEMSKLELREQPAAQPQLAFKNAAREDIMLGDFRGELLVVNIWATWCAPCLEEMPSLNALAADPPADNVRVIAISVDRTAEEAQDFLDSLELGALDLYHDKTFGIARVLEAPGLPVTVIYSPSGRELGRLVGGADWNSDEARRLIEVLASR